MNTLDQTCSVKTISAGVGLTLRSYTLAAVYLCVYITTLSATAAPLSTPQLYFDLSFKEKLIVNNMTITCSKDSSSSPAKYTSPIFTCRDISVEGIKLYHGYLEGQRTLCNDCLCGANKGEPNDIHALCKAMLKANGVKEPLSTAYVVKPSCSPTGLQKRIKYHIDTETSMRPVWTTVVSENGYIRTLQCMTKVPSR